MQDLRIFSIDQALLNMQNIKDIKKLDKVQKKRHEICRKPSLQRQTTGTVITQLTKGKAVKTRRVFKKATIKLCSLSY